MVVAGEGANESFGISESAILGMSIEAVRRGLGICLVEENNLSIGPEGQMID